MMIHNDRILVIVYLATAKQVERATLFAVDKTVHLYKKIE